MASGQLVFCSLQRTYLSWWGPGVPSMSEGTRPAPGAVAGPRELGTLQEVLFGALGMEGWG